MEWLKKFVYLLLLLAPIACYAQTFYGASFSYVAVPKEPEHIKGAQLMLAYYPDWHWQQLSMYVDGGFSHFWVDTAHHSALNIYSIAPVLRYRFPTTPVVAPYLDFSIGLSYLTRTRLDGRNLGIHFAFQDRLGLGTYIGAQQKLSIGFHAIHYSNAHLSEHNSGITALIMLDIGYRFN